MEVRRPNSNRGLDAADRGAVTSEVLNMSFSTCLEEEEPNTLNSGPLRLPFLSCST